MNTETRKAIKRLILIKTLNMIDALFSFELNDAEFKENYGYTKKQIKQVILEMNSEWK